MSRLLLLFTSMALALLLAGGVALAGSIMVVLAGPAHAAATITVNTAADEQNSNDQCSLREAIINSNKDDQSGSADCVAGAGEDTIIFDSSLSGETITLASHLPYLIEGTVLTIDGGSAKIAISGNNAVHVFGLDSGSEVTLNHLTMVNGSARFGTGGGIYNGGTLTVSNSTLSGNSAIFSGGAILNSGNTFGGKLMLINSTISGNSVHNDNQSGAGAGIYNSNCGTVTVINSTISGNSADFGGGIYNECGPLNLRNTIVAGNTATAPGGAPDVDAIFNSQGNNLIGNTTEAQANFVDSDLLNVDPLLGPLQDNGGPTDTRALLLGSPAVDQAASEACLPTDQRGVERKDGDGDGSVACDIGAFESSDITPPKVTTTTPANRATSVGRGTNLAATFSEKMSASTINATTFKLFKVNADGTQTRITDVVVGLSSDGLTAKLNPFGAKTTLLARNTKYKGVITMGAKDLANNSLAQQKSWTFTTKP